MNDAIRTFMHQLMTDRKYRAQMQQAMMYGHSTQKMDALQFASYQTAANLRNASPLELYSLLVLFYESTHHLETYNPNKFFDEKEIAGFSNKRSFVLTDLPNLYQLGEADWLSAMPWQQMVLFVRDVFSSPDAPKQFIAGCTSKEALNEAVGKIRNGAYHAPMLWINVRTDVQEIRITNTKLGIPLHAKACNLVISEELKRLVVDGSTDDLLNYQQSKRFVPVKITQRTTKELSGLVRYQVL